MILGVDLDIYGSIFFHFQLKSYFTRTGSLKELNNILPRLWKLPFLLTKFPLTSECIKPKLKSFGRVHTTKIKDWHIIELHYTLTPLARLLVAFSFINILHTGASFLSYLVKLWLQGLDHSRVLIFHQDINIWINEQMVKTV